MKFKSRIRFSIFALVVNLIVTPDFSHASGCTGATTSTEGNFTLVRFSTALANCTWNVPAGVTNLGLLIVGGGGGAGFGSLGGGGGAGQVLVTTSTISVNPNDTVTITVGDGGVGGYNLSQSFWNFGQNGETSSITINGNSFRAIGGGGGGGNNRTTGSSGGSGGGGASTNTPGSALTNNFENFTSYGYSASVNAASNGGGGAGAGGTNTNSSGGTGVTIFGLRVGGGGGGWASGVGATTFGGGSGGTGTAANDHGNVGTSGTGGGGGGGEKGGSGTVVFRYLAATVSSFSLAGGVTTATYRSPTTITAVVSIPSKVTFRAGNVIISGCKNKSATGSGSIYTANCSWKPSIRGKVAISASFSANESGASTPRTSPLNVTVSNRSGNRS
jgi:hypothetical protein